MQLIDGYNGGVAHISASMIRDHNLSLYGDSDCVLPVGNKFAYEVVDNNTIRISDGMAIIGGARATIEYGQTETAVIENGVSGYKRNDIIVIEYSKDNETLIESASVKVVKGSIGSSGVDPTLVTGNVRAGATVRQMALYRVKVNGLTIEGVEQLWKLWALPIEKGGTGGSTIVGAKTNLNILNFIKCWMSSGWTIPKTETTIPWIEKTGYNTGYYDGIFTVNNNHEIIKNTASSNIMNSVWSYSYKRVHVEFVLYFFNGFTSGERIVMKLYDGSTMIEQWNYYVKSASPYTMYSGSCWHRMGKDSALTLKISCTSGSGIINSGQSYITVSAWD